MASAAVELQLKIQSAVNGLGEVSKLAAEIEKLGGDASAVKAQAAGLADEMESLGAQQGLINSFAKLSGETKVAGEALAKSQANTKDLALAQKAAQSAVEGLEKSLFSAKKALASTMDPAEARALAGEIKTLEKSLAAAEKQAEKNAEAFERGRLASRQWADTLQAKKLALQQAGQAMTQAGLDSGKLDVAQAKVTLGMKEADRAAQALTAQLKTTSAGLATYGAKGQAFEWVADNTKTASAGMDAAHQAAKKAGPGIGDGLAAGKPGALTLKSAIAGLMDQLGGLAVGAGVAAFATASIAELRKAESSFKGLESISTHAGVTIGEAFKSAGKISADGLVSVTDASQALQNLLARGYKLDEAEAVLIRLKDAAAFNRQANLSMSEAVRQATEGLKNENSILVDNAGVTKNVAKMWAEYAKTIGVSAQSLTQGQKIQAEFNGIMAETAAQVGNAEKAAKTLDGGIAKLGQEASKLKTAFGGDLAPAAEAVGAVIGGLFEVAKHAGVGLNVLGANAGALVVSIGDIAEAIETLNFDGLGKRIADNFRLAGDMALAAVERYEKGLTPAIQAATAGTGAMGAAGAKAGADVAAGQAAAQTGINATGAAAAANAPKVADLFKSLDPGGSPQALEGLAGQLAAVGQAGKEATAEISAGWAAAVKAMSGPELARFIQTATTGQVELEGRLGDNTGKIAALAQAVDIGLRESFARFGIDADRALTGISSGVGKSLSDFDSLRQNLATVGIVGEKAGAIIAEALGKVANQAGTKQEIDAIRAKTIALGADGALSVAQVTAALATLEAKAPAAGAAVAAAQKAMAESKAETSRRAAELTEAEKASAVATDDMAGAADDAADSLGGLSGAQQQVATDAQTVTGMFDGTAVVLAQIEKLSSSVAAALKQQFADAKSSWAIWEDAQKSGMWWIEHLTQQQQGVADLTAEIQEATTSGHGLAAAAQASTVGFGDLNAEQLTGLQAAIDAAKAKMQQLRLEAEQTWQSAQQAEAAAMGQAKTIENLRWENQRNSLEAKLSEARAAGDGVSAANYQRAIDAYEKVHVANLKEIANKEKDQQETAAKQREAARIQAERELAELEGRANASARLAKQQEIAALKDRLSDAQRAKPPDRPTIDALQGQLRIKQDELAALPKKAKGGWIPGDGTEDTEPYLLTPGEFVVNATAAKKAGPALEALNNGRMPAAGGQTVAAVIRLELVAPGGRVIPAAVEGRFLNDLKAVQRAAGGSAI
jgi:hypothetical protein